MTERRTVQTRTTALRSFVRRRTGAAPPVLLFAQITHVAGDALVATGLATTLFFDIPVGEARAEVGLYLLLAFAPYAVLAPVMAPVVARRSSAHGGVVVLSDVGRAVLSVMLVWNLDVRWLYPLGFAVLVLSRTHGLSRAALVPALVEEDELLDANASISFVSGLAGAMGGVVGLGLSALVGPAGPLLLASGLFGVGTLSGLWLRPPGSAARRVVDKGWLTGTDSLRITIALVALRTVLGFVTMLLAFRFHGGDDRTALVTAGLALALGTWSASVLAPQLASALSQVRIATAAVAVLAVVAVVATSTDGLALAATLALTVGVSGGTARLAFDAHVQEAWPQEARGPGYARYETVLQLAWVLGAVPGAFVAMSLDWGAVLAACVAGAGLGIATLLPSRGADDRRQKRAELH